MRGTLSDRSYELMVIVAPEIGEDDTAAVLDRVAADIGVAGGTLERRHTETPWGRRRLSYPIRHDGRDVREGFYALHYFIMHPDKLNDFERDMRLNERIMRHLTLHIEAVPELPPPPEEPAVEGVVAILVEVSDTDGDQVAEVAAIVTPEDEVAVLELVIEAGDVAEIAEDTVAEDSEPVVAAKPARKPRASKTAADDEIAVVEQEDSVVESDSTAIENLVEEAAEAVTDEEA